MFLRPTPILYKSLGKVEAKSGQPSSRQWLMRQINDPYVKQRIQNTFKGPGSVYWSRAAFKLLQIDQKYNIIPKTVNKLEEETNRM